MGQGSGKDGKDDPEELGPDDSKLWKAFTYDVKLLEKAGRVTSKKMPHEKEPLKAKRPPSDRSSQKSPPSAPQKSATDQTPQLDKKTELRLRRGEMPIEGRLDLHGYNQDQARSLLNDFVLASHAEGKRCLLIITGKGQRGKGGPGILKQKLPEWLAMPPVRDKILQTIPAIPKHGGGGACYLYLKRQRDYDF